MKMKLCIISKSGSQFDFIHKVFIDLGISILDGRGCTLDKIVEFAPHVVLLDFVNSDYTPDELGDIYTLRDVVVINSETNFAELDLDDLNLKKNQLINSVKNQVDESLWVVQSVHSRSSDNITWFLLGGSSSAPAEMNKFFQRLKPSPNKKYIVVQHHSEFALEQIVMNLTIDCIDKWKSVVLNQPRKGSEADIFVLPRNRTVEFNDELLCPIKNEDDQCYQPSVNATIESVVASTDCPLSIVMFSGLGDDGSESIRINNHQLGQVYVRDPRESVADSMPLATIRQAPNAIIGEVEQIAEAISK